MNFWRGKKVFVTGHTGFKGSWLSRILAQRGALVTGYALAPSTAPNLFDDGEIREGLREHIVGDIRDFSALSSAIEKAKPDVVFHLAAQALVRDSYADPVGTFSTNVMGTVNILESLKRSPRTQVMINVTSDKCYENQEWDWGYRENEPMGGSDPYSASKGCAELVTSAFRRSFFSKDSVRVASARAGNVIGGGDWSKDRLFPDAARAFAEGRPVVIRNPSSTRPWQHVLDPVHGYMKLAEALWDDASLAEGWNFGPDQEGSKTVGWMMNELCRFWGPGAAWVNQSEPGAPKEAKLLKLDCAKARARLNWRPVFNVGEAIHLTAEWYRSYGQGLSARDLTDKQIKFFETLVSGRVEGARDEQRGHTEMPLL